MKLYESISTAFCVIVVISCVISSKFINLPFLPFEIPAGLITYPLTFLISDLVTELFGPKKAKSMVIMAFIMTIFSYSLLKLALILPSHNLENQKAFEAVVGMNGIVIFASLTAYLVAQMLDIQSYSFIKKRTGEKHLWARNNGSTLLSQIVDTVIVNMIHLYFGLGMSFASVCSIMVFSYCYKAFFSIANTPLFYLCVYWAKKHTMKGTKIIPFPQHSH